MDEVVLEGVTYVRAATAAKRFKYTTDYVGQLCRAEKVDAKLVGRSWFVNPDSLANHKQAKKTPQNTKNSQPSISRDLKVDTSFPAQKRTVEPVLAAKTARQIHNPHHGATRQVSVTYSVDDGHLIPELNIHKNTGATVRVDHAESTGVSVQSDTKNTSFAPVALPDVALSGTLKVGELVDKIPKDGHKAMNKNPDIASKNKAISDKETQHKKNFSSQPQPKKTGIKINRIRTRPATVDTVKTAKRSTSLIGHNSKAGNKITISKPVKSTSNIANQVTIPKNAATVHATKKPLSQKSTQNLSLVTLKTSNTQSVQSKDVKTLSKELSLFRFVLLLFAVACCGLAVGYLLVVSSTEYTVTASVGGL